MKKEIQTAISALIGKEKLVAIRILMGLDPAVPVVVPVEPAEPAPAPTELKKVKAKDGTEITYEGDTPVVGVAVFIKDADGKDIPAPDGNIELEDGTILSVKGGIITDVKPAEKKDEPPTFDAKEEMKKLKNASETAISDLKIQYKKDLIDLQATIKKQSMAQDNQTEITKQIFSIIEKLADLPSAMPAVKKDGFNRTTNTGLAELMASAAQLSKLTFKN